LIRILFLTIFFTCILFATDSTKIKQKKEQILETIDIQDKEAKQTISNIVDSKFNLKSYKENYFLPFSYRYKSDFVYEDAHGHTSNNTETEFQVSIRYDFSADIFGYGEIYSFGYTQRSWWQIYVPSAFFRESNYQPEFFVTIPTYKFMKSSNIKAFKLSFIHQSNGRGGEWERSWNRLSLATYFLYNGFITEFEFWYRFKDKIDYNPDITHYLGYGNVKLIYPYKKHLLKLSLGGNLFDKRYRTEMIYTYPLPVRDENDLFLFVKSFNGYGESLIDYNHKVNKISIGISISR